MKVGKRYKYQLTPMLLLHGTAGTINGREDILNFDIAFYVSHDDQWDDKDVVIPSTLSQTQKDELQVTYELLVYNATSN